MAEILFQLGSHYNCQTLTPLRRAKAVDFTLERVRVGLQLGFWGAGPPLLLVSCFDCFEKGCPILAFFARVGGKAACSESGGVPRTSVVEKSTPLANGGVDDVPPTLRKSAKDGTPPEVATPARSKARSGPPAPRRTINGNGGEGGIRTPDTR